MNVLVLNAGSSSLKFQVIATDLERIKEYKDERVCRGEVERLGTTSLTTRETVVTPAGARAGATSG